MVTLMERETVGQDTRCRVVRNCARRSFWEADIHSDDDFEIFIREISRAWADAQTDRQGLHLHINQVEIGDI